jgi:hypothetical protein
VNSSKRIRLAQAATCWFGIPLNTREAHRLSICRLSLAEDFISEIPGRLRDIRRILVRQSFRFSKSTSRFQANLKPNRSRPRSKRTCSGHFGAGAPEQHLHRLGSGLSFSRRKRLKFGSEPARDAQDICTRE